MSTPRTNKKLLEIVEAFEGNTGFSAQQFRQSPKLNSLAYKADSFSRDIQWVRTHIEDMCSKAETALGVFLP